MVDGGGMYLTGKGLVTSVFEAGLQASSFTEEPQEKATFWRPCPSRKSTWVLLKVMAIFVRLTF